MGLYIYILHFKFTVWRWSWTNDSLTSPVLGLQIHTTTPSYLTLRLKFLDIWPVVLLCKPLLSLEMLETILVIPRTPFLPLFRDDRYPLFFYDSHSFVCVYVLLHVYDYLKKIYLWLFLNFNYSLCIFGMFLLCCVYKNPSCCMSLQSLIFITVVFIELDYSFAVVIIITGAGDQI